MQSSCCRFTRKRGISKAHFFIYRTEVAYLDPKGDKSRRDLNLDLLLHRRHRVDIPDLMLLRPSCRDSFHFSVKTNPVATVHIKSTKY